MRFSHQVQYAICGVFDLAYNGRGEPVQIRVISERQAIPGRYLEQIFQRLRRAGLVTSKRGPGGGYTLSRSPARITLRDVVEAVEGPFADTLQMKAGFAPRRDPVPARFPVGAARGPLRQRARRDLAGGPVRRRGPRPGRALRGRAADVLHLK